MHRFQINADLIRNGSILLDERESRHALVVLRLKAPEAVGLIDGKGRAFKGVVAGIENGFLRVRIDAGSLAGAVPWPFPVQVTLAVSVIKPERMELLIQKACELGADAILPVRSERSIIRLSKERWQEKIKRWRKIAVESCKQCGLPATPQIHEAADLKTVLSSATGYDKILIPTLSGVTRPLREALPRPAPDRLLALIGPEGDFSDKEVALAVSYGARPVSLGPLVLRTETAVFYLLSVLNFFYGETGAHVRGKLNE
ncbi:MAG: hypothetical protein COT00_02720 [Candidatus Omnitrophica bacterium CG07_land_8_20_14_0_80_50_8]|nr:MAG: hypothetical protein COT00_02720 [Candidatus Omnitrophica bacterium CG07_land_8_20_14_0_80_50_8]